MTERRETDRASAPAGTSQNDGERIAKYLARAGIASRRACETLIGDGKVTVNGKRLTTPAFKVTGREDIRVAGKPVSAPEPTRLWRYHKPAGLITTTQDPAGRRTVFEELPKSLPRVMTVGRLDLNTEGLLLLTNDGELARALELPSNQMARTYRARAHGRVSDGALARLGQGIEVDGERFAPIAATLEQELGANNWLRVTLAEGKKREVRRALEAVGLEVNRLIRVAYGPFDLGALKPGAVTEVPESELPDLLGELMPRQRVQEHARQKTARRDARLRKQVRKRRQ
jgi:23S rRNA pseudouridine2605 synthase